MENNKFQTPYKVSPNFFDEFPDKVMAELPKAAPKRSFWNLQRYVAAAAAIFFIVMGTRMLLLQNTGLVPKQERFTENDGEKIEIPIDVWVTEDSAAPHVRGSSMVKHPDKTSLSRDTDDWILELEDEELENLLKPFVDDYFYF